MIDGNTDAGSVAPDGQAVPTGVLYRVLARLDPAGRRVVLERHRLHQQDLRMLAVQPPTPETAKLVAPHHARSRRCPR